MRLSELMDRNGELAAVDIQGLACDSRDVRPGYLFAAFPGSNADGRKYIPQALEKGAVAVLAGAGNTIDTRPAILVTDDNPRLRFAKMAARYYGKQPQFCVACTGTNGKSSVVSFTRQLWQLAGLNAASMGTLGIDSDAIKIPGGLTTPDALKIHKNLSELAGAGVDYAALEASSHGLSQYRLDGVYLSAAAFTNLSRDHLDYHGTFDDYLYAKARLFGELLPPGAAAVIHRDGEYSAEIEHIAWARGHRILTVGAKDADIALLSRVAGTDGQNLEIRYENRTYKIHFPLIGHFQVENALVAAGLAIATGGDAAMTLQGLEKLKGVAGRLEKAGVTACGAAAYLDYAHTPAGLKTVLHAAREHRPRSLHLVFGCGGDRDKGKRPEMGAIAAGLADHIIVTDDNPRTEDAAVIRAEILAACPDALEIGDRRAAIRKAVAGLKKGDLLLVTGKGHEEGQIVGDRVLPFSDIVEIRAAIQAWKGEGI